MDISRFSGARYQGIRYTERDGQRMRGGKRVKMKMDSPAVYTEPGGRDSKHSPCRGKG